MNNSLQISLLCLCILISTFPSSGQRDNKFYVIVPAVTDGLTDSIKFVLPVFEISKQITLLDYKFYLKSIKKDSSAFFYQSQLPDSSIGSKEAYKQYLNNAKYEKYPVLGISWDNAMNYCKWKTIVENEGKIEFIYRLPANIEWNAALVHLDEMKIEHDFNQNYSDWLLESKDESVIHYIRNTPFDDDYTSYVYFHRQDDPPALKRKQVIGNSYLFQNEELEPYSFSYYANEGYRNIGFRCVKSPANDDKDYNSITSTILEYWGLKK